MSEAINYEAYHEHRNGRMLEQRYQEVLASPKFSLLLASEDGDMIEVVATLEEMAGTVGGYTQWLRSRCKDYPTVKVVRQWAGVYDRSGKHAVYVGDILHVRDDGQGYEGYVLVEGLQEWKRLRELCMSATVAGDVYRNRELVASKITATIGGA